MVAPIAYLLEVQGQAESVAALDNFDRSLGKADASATSTTKSTTSLGKEMGIAAGGITAAASGVYGLYLQYDQLEKIELRIEKAKKSQEDATRNLSIAEEALAKLVAEGTATQVDMEQAVSKVESAKQGLSIADERLQITQQDLTQGQLAFALSVMPTVQAAITGVQAAMGALRAIHVASTIAQAAGIPVTVADVGAKSALAAATGAAAGATGGLSLAVRLFHIAMGPIGWLILGIGTFLALFATNAFGVRDAINAMGKAIGDAFPILRPLLDALAQLANWIFPQTEDASKDATVGISDDTDALIAKYKQNIDSSEQMEAGVTTAFSITSTESGASMDSLAKNVDKNADNIVSDANRIEKAMKMIGGSKDIASATDTSGGKKGFDLTSMAGPMFMSKAAGVSTTSARADMVIDTFNLTIQLGEQQIAKLFKNIKSGDTLKYV